MEEQSSLTMTGKCFYINLSRRGDRRLAVEQELHTLGVEYERVPAGSSVCTPHILRRSDMRVRSHIDLPYDERNALIAITC